MCNVELCNSRYVSVLVELTRIEGTKHGKMIASQMLDVAIRVQTVRPFIVTQMVGLNILNKKLLSMPKRKFGNIKACLTC